VPLSLPALEPLSLQLAAVAVLAGVSELLQAAKSAAPSVALLASAVRNFMLCTSSIVASSFPCAY
jgi:hypothetical protein